jgi:hypothetical protein
MTIKAPVIRYHGAKFRLAPWVLQHLPPHTCYVESFGGAGRGSANRTECIWLSPACIDQVSQIGTLSESVNSRRLVKPQANRPKTSQLLPLDLRLLRNWSSSF